MLKMFGSRVWLALAALFMLSAAPTSAVVAGEKPFAEVKVVLQISDPNPFKQTLVLNVANNLIKHYGADKVELEIVAFGPGLRMLFEDNPNKARIKKLVENADVQFSACSNTMANYEGKLGHAPELNQYSTVVGGGIVRIVDLVKKGYILVKP